ncbi:MAG: AraC family transcriptional regulator [Verrucomicrobiota bacterium]
MKCSALRKATPSVPEFFSPDVIQARRFYLDLRPPKQRRLAVVCGGREQCTSNYAIHRRTFPFYSIEYVARGHGSVRLKGQAHDLLPGRLFSYGPGVAHDITSHPSNPLVKYFVDFTGPSALELLQECKLPPGHITQIFPPDTVTALFDELIQSGQRGGQAGTELCWKLLECLALKITASRAPLTGVETLAFTTYQECRRHIDAHFLRLRTLAQIAAECHANSAYLCRLFRRYDHQSPYQYLLRLKMRHAAERLQQPGTLVKQVAEAVGFVDPFHFSRVFRSVLGLSPMAFRKLR